MKILGIYLVIINLTAFLLYGVDKKRAIDGKWRIPEATLIGVAALGGGLGALLGMLAWHHKTKKWKFRLLVPALLIIWMVAGYMLLLGPNSLIPGAFSKEPEPVMTESVSQEAVKVPDTGASEDKSALTTQPVVTDFDITLAFAGDVNFDDTWSVMSYYHSMGDDLEAVIDPKYIEAMRDADVMWINNEFTYSEGGSPLEGKAYTFRSRPENVKLLCDMGVDIVGLANNHVYDYGKEAFLDTLDTLDSAGIPYVGAGHDLDEAKAPVYVDVEGVRIAYVAASRAEKYKMTPQATDTEPGILRCYDNALFLESIKEAEENADFVVALPHWGTEYSEVLEPAQTEGALLYTEAGADAVIGAHTHCLQETTEIDGKPVVYSLGNFWFNEKTLKTMLYEIHLTGTKTEEPDGGIQVRINDVATEELMGTQSGCRTMMDEENE
ncbi:MAG: DUF1294 domain-containing protein [Lachnospiraceae bacterium]|nr:DUF1294 domain-containing protein [Lachnospiraceae bacterium]